MEELYLDTLEDMYPELTLTLDELLEELDKLYAEIAELCD